MPIILCIDDGHGFQSIRHILEQAGCDVVAVSSDHALSFISRQSIDGVVLPYREGNTDLLSLRNRIHHLDPALPVLLLSEPGNAMRGSLHTLVSYTREHPASERLACETV